MMEQAGGMDWQALSDRLLRLARLDTSVFDEVKGDPAATLPAIVVAAAATFLAGIGGWLWWIFQDFQDSGEIFVKSVILGGVFSVALWIVWLLVAYVILTQVFREQADWQQMLRTMGLAAAPLAISLLILITPIGLGIGLASVALFFGLTTIAIQAVTPDTAPAKVLVANLAGFAVWAIVLTLLVTDDNAFAPGVFVYDAPSEAMSSIAGAFEDFGGIDFDIPEVE
jgi:hypothetical protein